MGDVGDGEEAGAALVPLENLTWRSLGGDGREGERKVQGRHKEGGLRERRALGSTWQDGAVSYL